MVPYGSIYSIIAESHCRRASTTGCYLPASPPKGTAGGTAGSLRASLLSGAIIYATSRRTLRTGTGSPRQVRLANAGRTGGDAAGHRLPAPRRLKASMRLTEVSLC